MKDIEITLREMLVSIVIILIMIGLGFMLAEKIHDAASSESEKYFKSLKVNNDPELFNYSLRTEVGYMTSQGTFKANEPVSDKLIKGKYFSIIKDEEHYVMKTRTVTYTDSKGETRTKTETYWEWDWVDRKKSNTKSFSYLGKDFKYNKIKFKNHSHKKTVKTSSHVRFQIYVIPKEFNGTLFSKAEGKTINDNVLYEGKSIKDVMKQKENAAENYVTGFWIAWIFLIILVTVVFVALENRYINNN